MEGKLRFVGNGYACRLPTAVGDQCEIIGQGGRRIPAEVIRFVDGQAQIQPYERAEDVQAGMTVVRSRRRRHVPVGEGVLGRILDGLGRPVDDLGPLKSMRMEEVRRRPPAAIDRQRIDQRFTTGQKAIDGLLTCGRGQRVGIFSGSGVGKSTLLGQIAKASDAEVSVIALVGERGVELRPFIEDCLGPEGLRRSVVVMSTCEQQPLMRKRSIETAISIADSFRQQGRNVLFLLDSLTRLAMAQRELGLSIGEPPSSRGYTPSVFQLMAETLEQLGNSSRGSITGFVTVLVDGDDLEEPISDAARALLDGHIVLDR
ncbi:MAG: FliI/YscN family ATPase, partial [Planctomycetes bacterium]|nr:FliI/YscN family ATPase [Planctomycetota bacterium]